MPKKNFGKIFEQNWQNSIPDDIYFMRIKDSASSYNRTSNTSYTCNNPYDYFMLYEGFFIPMELKSTKDKSFSIQSEKEENGKDIKYHQIKSLEKAQKYKNVISGFILDFRNYDTYWLSIYDFEKIIEKTKKKSINLKEVEDNGGVKINKKLMKVNYKYDVLELLQNLLKAKEDEK